MPDRRPVGGHGCPCSLHFYCVIRLAVGPATGPIFCGLQAGGTFALSEIAVAARSLCHRRSPASVDDAGQAQLAGKDDGVADAEEYDETIQLLLSCGNEAEIREGLAL